MDKHTQSHVPGPWISIHRTRAMLLGHVLGSWRRTHGPICLFPDPHPCCNIPQNLPCVLVAPNAPLLCSSHCFCYCFPAVPSNVQGPVLWAHSQQCQINSRLQNALRIHQPFEEAFPGTISLGAFWPLLDVFNTDISSRGKH